MKVSKGALGFGVGTVISRGFGLIREVIFAYLFGASPEMDAFRVAFNIPNLFRESLAEGSLTPAFVPLFSDHYTKRGKEDAFGFANLILGAFLLIVGTIVLLGIAFSPALVKMISFGFTRIPGKFALTVMLTRIMFPFLLIITISALFMGILNFFNQFFITGVAPSFFNIGIIATGLLLAPKLGIRSIAIGAIVGGLFQLIYQLIPLIRRGFQWHPHFKLVHPGIKRILLLMLPIALGY
ncbi:MAG TPA: murein biosynthesis integral membrane protein MurJ, partial [bacterium (Candidatus Stahlbacteria)]|nr:murein biosynthesis integral membrane protein MurJ [Candidatus Stahlbacteria bacterium]